jgi:D-lactate dehydrogenase
MKAVFFEFENWTIPIINEKMQEAGIEVVFISNEELNPQHLPNISDIDILSMINSKIDKNILDSLPNLKLIACASSGYDHIDITSAKEKGIIVTNDPAYSAQTVSEFTFALMLALSRQLKKTIDNSSKGIFDRSHIRGFELSGKTIGIIGAGRIASRVMKIACSFDMKILYFSSSGKKELEGRYGAEFVSLDDLLENSHYITIHIPYTKQTYHLINKDNIYKIRKGAFLVNTARGKIVDTEAVLMALKNNHLAGVALDVFEGEEIWLDQNKLMNNTEMGESEDNSCTISDTILKSFNSFNIQKFENGILTPHIAFNTREAYVRFLMTNIDTIMSFSKRERLEYRVV